jgi:hypothetical protein
LTVSGPLILTDRRASPGGFFVPQPADVRLFKVWVF